LCIFEGELIYSRPLKVPSIAYIHLSLHDTVHQPRTALTRQAIGAVIPESAGSASWSASGEQLQKDGNAEIEEAKAAQASQATWDAAGAKVKSYVLFISRIGRWTADLA
jgi:hypothetical protein